MLSEWRQSGACCSLTALLNPAARSDDPNEQDDVGRGETDRVMN